MQKPTARKRGFDPDFERNQVLKSGIKLKVLPCEENYKLNPVPEKSDNVHVTCLNNNRAFLYGCANLLVLRSKRRPRSITKVVESEKGNYPTGLFPFAFLIILLNSYNQLLRYFNIY